MQIFLPSPQLVIPFRSYSFHFILYSWSERECWVWEQKGVNYLPKWPFCDSVSPSNRFVSPSNHQLQLSSYICYMWQEWAFFHGLYYISVHLNVFQLNLVIVTMCQNSTDHVPELNWSKYSNFIMCQNSTDLNIPISSSIILIFISWIIWEHSVCSDEHKRRSLRILCIKFVQHSTDGTKLHKVDA